MAQPKHPARRRIWRVTPEAPMGEFVELDAVGARADLPVPEREPGGDTNESNWIQSSFDLAIGLDVTDFEDTVPADLLDELFRPPPRRK